MRSGKREDLNADVLEGHISTAICHAGNVSYRLGQAAPLAAQRSQLGSLACWNAMHERYVTYLAAIGVDPNLSVLGPWLEIDVEKECFRGARAEEANRIVRGFYREPYLVPELAAS